MRACCAWSAALCSLTSCTLPSGPQLPTPSGLAAPVPPSRSCTRRLVPLRLKRGSFAAAVKWFSPRTVIVTPLPRVARPRTNPHAAVVHAALFTSVDTPVISGAASVIVCAAARAVRSALCLPLAAARRATLGVSAMLDAMGLSHPERVACVDLLDALAPSSSEAFMLARHQRCWPAAQRRAYAALRIGTPACCALCAALKPAAIGPALLALHNAAAKAKAAVLVALNDFVAAGDLPTGCF